MLGQDSAGMLDEQKETLVTCLTVRQEDRVADRLGCTCGRKHT